MPEPEIIGRVTATESKPTTTTKLRFWVSDDVILRPFDIVKIEHLSKSKGTASDTYAIVQELEHITDSQGYLHPTLAHHSSNSQLPSFRQIPSVPVRLEYSVVIDTLIHLHVV